MKLDNYYYLEYSNYLLLYFIWLRGLEQSTPVFQTKGSV